MANFASPPSAETRPAEAPPRPRAAIGDLLRSAREEQGIELDGIAAQLRIRAAYLAAIEQARYDRLPGQVYALGFVRAYANQLGLDGEEAVRRFKLESAGMEQRRDLAFPMPLTPRSIPGGRMLLVACILALCAYGIWHYVSTDGSRPERVAAVPADLLPPPPAAPKATTPSIPAAQAAPAAPSANTEAASPPTAAEPAPAPAAAAHEGAAASSSPPATTSASPSLAPEAAPAPVTSVAEAPLPPPATGALVGPPAPPPSLPGGAATTSGETETAAAETPTVPAATPKPEAAPTNPPVQAATATPAPAATPPHVYGVVSGPSRITLKALKDCWILVRDDGGKVVAERTLHAGDLYRVPEREGLVLRTGNATGLEVEVDDKTAPPLGGTVRTVALDPARLAAGKAVE